MYACMYIYIYYLYITYKCIHRYKSKYVCKYVGTVCYLYLLSNCITPTHNKIYM